MNTFENLQFSPELIETETESKQSKFDSKAIIERLRGPKNIKGITKKIDPLRLLKQIHEKDFFDIEEYHGTGSMGITFKRHGAPSIIHVDALQQLRYLEPSAFHSIAGGLSQNQDLRPSFDQKITYEMLGRYANFVNEIGSALDKKDPNVSIETVKSISPPSLDGCEMLKEKLLRMIEQEVLTTETLAEMYDEERGALARMAAYLAVILFLLALEAIYIYLY